MSPWISSDTTSTPWRRQIAPRRASSSAVQTRPTGLCGLHRKIIRVRGLLAALVQTVEIHLVSAVPQDQTGSRPSGAVFRDDVGEIEKHRRLHDDPIARLRERVGSHCQCVQDVWRTQDMGRIDLPSVPSIQPARERRDQPVGDCLVAIDAMRGPCATIASVMHGATRKSMSATPAGNRSIPSAPSTMR